MLGRSGGRGPHGSTRGIEFVLHVSWLAFSYQFSYHRVPLQIAFSTAKTLVYTVRFSTTHGTMPK